MQSFRGQRRAVQGKCRVLIPNKWEVWGWEMVDTSTDASITAPQNNMKTMKRQLTIKWTDDSTGITSTHQCVGVMNTTGNWQK